MSDRMNEDSSSQCNAFVGKENQWRHADETRSVSVVSHLSPHTQPRAAASVSGFLWKSDKELDIDLPSKYLRKIAFNE